MNTAVRAAVRVPAPTSHRLALMARAPAGATLGLVVIRTARDGIVGVKDQRTRARTHAAKLSTQCDSDRARSADMRSRSEPVDS
jgi:hypothetical protein